MTERYHDQAPPGLAAAPGYSQVVSASGRLVFVAGQVALDEEGTVVGHGDVVRQAEQVFANLERALDAAGASFSDVVKLNYYFIDISALPAVRLVRDRYVDRARPPASTAVEVTGLARPEFLIEIEAQAIIDVAGEAGLPHGPPPAE
jgi:enamine deaminase RidA (YjgF/YER057c/UK114 family)